jgi:hypothetical protein
MNSIRKMRVGLVAALVLVAVGAASAVAQDTGDPILRRHVISTNPILDLFQWYNLEWEIRVTPRSTAGLFGSLVTLKQDTEDIDGSTIEVDEKYYSVTAFYRYYPNEAFKGFFIGGRLGWYHVEEDDPVTGKDEAQFTGIGVDVGYGWLLGEPQRIAVGIGIGAVRLFGGDLDDTQATLPTIRFINVGIAF